MEDESSFETTGRRLVYLAAERTLMSWIRTALSLMALGFVIDRLGLVLRQTLPEAGAQLYPKAFSFWAGTALVGLGAVMALVATVRYLQFALSIAAQAARVPARGFSWGLYLLR